MKKIILCADDFAQNCEISKGILQLVEKKRLSAVSCMTNSPYWPEYGAQLKRFHPNLKIGLHFNLTQDFPLYPKKFSLINLLFLSHIHLINNSVIVASFTEQLQQFNNIMGFYPDFIDGHQHIHQLPIIRNVILDYAKKKSIMVRLARPEDGRLKSKIIRLTGANTFAKLLKKFDISHNTSFAGVYDFSQNYSKLFPQFLTQVSAHGLIMCHPGLASIDKADPIAHARVQEFNYFNSDQFLNDCHLQQIIV
ncbi:MAG: ChbG/HpnK family deacetylase [Legionellales bacterium]|nr:ChbG/HpnK family deacetylase [Legionellales bacterium]